MKSEIHKIEKSKPQLLSNKLPFAIAAFLLLFTLQSNAQISVSLNIGSRPAWYNHEAQADYYYLPEIETYYDVRSSVYIYLGPRGWIRSVYLPEYCENYDVNRGYRVALDYRGSCPYTYIDNHRERYSRDCHTNYRQQYYQPNYENRRVYVNNNYYRDYGDDHDDDRKGYKKEKHNKGRGNGHGNK